MRGQSSLSSYLIFLLFPITIILILIAASIRDRLQRPRRRTSQMYGEQWELDLRLTYKRFKEIYPNSTITYPEYKELQKRSAFKRSVSSEENKRMVR